MTQDIRWEQRFENYQLALRKLSESVDFIKHNNPIQNTEEGETALLDEMIKEALIQRFEYTHKLAWKVMKDYAMYQGIMDVGGSRDAVREAFQLKLITDGKVWMEMILSRNLTSHTYNKETADQIYSKIISLYYPAFLAFEHKMLAKINGNTEEFL